MQKISKKAFRLSSPIKSFVLLGAVVIAAAVMYVVTSGTEAATAQKHAPCPQADSYKRLAYKSAGPFRTGGWGKYEKIPGLSDLLSKLLSNPGTIGALSMVELDNVMKEVRTLIFKNSGDASLISMLKSILKSLEAEQGYRKESSRYYLQKAEGWQQWCDQQAEKRRQASPGWQGGGGRTGN